MVMQKKLFIVLIVGATLTLGSPTPAHAGFLGNLLGGAAEVFVPGAGRAVNELTNEIDGTNDRLRQDVLEQERLEAQRQAEEQRLQLRREIEAQVRAEMEGQRAQTQPRSTTSTVRTTDMEARWRAVDEKVCNQTTFSSSAFQACVRSKKAQRDALNGTPVGTGINGMMNEMQKQMDPSLFNILFPR